MSFCVYFDSVDAKLNANVVDFCLGGCPAAEFR